MDETQVYTITIDINNREYTFEMDAEEWGFMTPREQMEWAEDCEIEARERYCETRTSVLILDPDGQEVELF